MADDTSCPICSDEHFECEHAALCLDLTFRDIGGGALEIQARSWLKQLEQRVGEILEAGREDLRPALLRAALDEGFEALHSGADIEDAVGEADASLYQALDALVSSCDLAHSGRYLDDGGGGCSVEALCWTDDMNGLMAYVQSQLHQLAATIRASLSGAVASAPDS